MTRRRAGGGGPRFVVSSSQTSTSSSSTVLLITLGLVMGVALLNIRAAHHHNPDAAAAVGNSVGSFGGGGPPPSNHRDIIDEGHGDDIRSDDDDSSSASESSSGTAQPPPAADERPPPSFDWDSTMYTDKCLYVENVCHSAHRFFYYPTSSDPPSSTVDDADNQEEGRDETNSSRRRGRSRSDAMAAPFVRQPDLLWDTISSVEFPPNQRETVYRRYYRFRRHFLLSSRRDNGSTTSTSSSSSSSNVTTPQCTWSPITNHLVLYGAHNVMLGEFYDRTLVYLHLLHAHNPWVHDSQLYLHLHYPYQGIMDSHHLFTEPYRNWPLLSLTHLWDQPKCQCLSRLVLCGYTATEERIDENPKLGRYVPPRYRPGPMSGNYDFDTYDRQLQKQQQDSKTTASTVLVVKPTSWHNEDDYGDAVSFREVRKYLRTDLIVSNSNVQVDVDRYRTWIRDGQPIATALDGSTSTNTKSSDEFVLVGLAQRVRRRRWRNLDDVRPIVQATLDELWLSGDIPRRILLVEMNVEVDSSSYQQLVRHAALDGLVGIHGAQLTEAVWMKDYSWVIELLPYIPSYATNGHWTRTVKKPTPLGKIFVGTELNHAGLRLGIESSPYCGGNVSDTSCWTDKRNMWDVRDFDVSAELLERIVTTFFVSDIDDGSTTAATCQDWKARAADQFVLYNVNCADNVLEESSVGVTPHAYYWPSDE